MVPGAVVAKDPAMKKVKKKKSKKDKASAKLEEATVLSNEAEVVGKKSKKQTEAAAENGVTASDGVVRKKKKSKKRKDKTVDDHIESVSLPTPPACEPTVSKAEKKKKKKRKLHNELEAAPITTNGVAVAPVAPSVLSSFTPQQAQEWQQSHSIEVEGCAIGPVASFHEAGFTADVLHATRDFQQPSPIQAQCWPIIMSSRDLVGIAATGSGKTLAFGLPALQRIVSNNKLKQGATVLVLAPTRELALQTTNVMNDAGKECGVQCVCVYGGVPKKDQVAALKRGAQIVCGTPGRIQDLLEDGSLRLCNVDYLVLDEADRMLDLGFEPSVRAIIAKTKTERQTLMFSATWPTAVQKLASEFLRTPVRVTVGSKTLSANHSVKQVVEVIESHDKEERLLKLLNKYHSSRNNRVIVFVLYKKEASRMESFLTRKGWKVAAVHGDLGQHQRTQAVNAFKDGTSPLLLATDVAARGLDIPDVEVVINYSFPLTTEDYVHRIGRTGRAGKTGVSHTLFCGQTDKPRAGELINVLKEANQTVPPELLKFGTTVKKKESKLYGAHFRDVDINQKATKLTFDSDSD